MDNKNSRIWILDFVCVVFEKCKQLLIMCAFLCVFPPFLILRLFLLSSPPLFLFWCTTPPHTLIHLALQRVVLLVVPWGAEPHVLSVWVRWEEQLLSADQPCVGHQPRPPVLLLLHRPLHCDGKLTHCPHTSRQNKRNFIIFTFNMFRVSTKHNLIKHAKTKKAVKNLILLQTEIHCEVKLNSVLYI